MNAKLPVGIIGLGRMGQVYAKHLAAMATVEIAAVSDLSDVETASIAKQYGAKMHSVHYQDILDNKDVKAIFIVTPTSTHAEIAIAAAKAGKAIFCEKPIALTLAETDKTIAVLEETKAMLQVGYMRRFDPGYLAAKKQIEAGIIGKPVTFKSIGRDPFCPPLAFANPKKSGGLIIDMAIHDFDLGRWLMAAEVERVYAEGGVLAFPELETIGDIDNAIVNMRFENGTLGNVEVSRNAVYGYDIRTEILGTEGGLNIGYYRETPLLTMTKKGINHDMVPYFPERFGEAYLNQAHDFINRVINEKEPAISAYDARASLLIGLAATDSYNQARPVNLSEYPTLV